VNVKRQCKGYTLIEVLVAMMILAMSLTVIFRIFSGGLYKIGIASDYARAVIVAESVLAAAGSTEMLQAGESRGDLHDKYRWVRVVTPYLAESGQSFDGLPVNVYRVSVVVEWPANRGDRSLGLSTIKLSGKRR